MSNIYGAKGKDMLLDLKRSEWLPPYDEDGARTLLNETSDVFQKLQTLVLAKNDPTALSDPVKVRISYLHQCVHRNHRYLNCYFTHRLERIRDLRWEAGPVIPESFINQDKLSSREREYFGKYSDILTQYNQFLGFDVTSDVEPPKDLLIEVRVLEDCGKVMTDSGPVNLEKGTILFLRRSQVEPFVREGKVEHVLQDSEC